MNQNPLSEAANILDKMILNQLREQEKFDNSGIEEKGTEMTEAQLRIALRRMKDCGITTAPVLPDGFEEDAAEESDNFDLKHNTELPELSLAQDAATADKETV